MTRTAVLVVNPNRDDVIKAARDLAPLLTTEGFTLQTISDISIPGIENVSATEINRCEVVVVLGGDGTILRGAEISRVMNVPLLGINLGHVGFMAEVEKPSIAEIADSIITKSYKVETRVVLSYKVIRGGEVFSQGWALNEIAVERRTSQMVELFVQIDDRPLSRWGCDGVICATPTGSTAYAFSAGGPVLWPEIEALVLLPIAAHALFSRPMVVSPSSEIIIEVESKDAILSADSLRELPLVQSDRVVITKDSSIVKLAHVKATLFTDRLVAKFKLPVEGWRGE